MLRVTLLCRQFYLLSSLHKSVRLFVYKEPGNLGVINTPFTWLFMYVFDEYFRFRFTSTPNCEILKLAMQHQVNLLIANNYFASVIKQCYIQIPCEIYTLDSVEVFIVMIEFLNSVNDDLDLGQSLVLARACFIRRTGLPKRLCVNPTNHTA